MRDTFSAKSVFALALLAGIFLSASEQTRGQQVMFAVNNSNQLISFNSVTPGSVFTIGTITGLSAGDTIVGIDFRPADSRLYGLGVNLGTGTARVYIIDRTCLGDNALGAGGRPG